MAGAASVNQPTRTLEGLNLRVDPKSKQLVDAGPAPAAPAGGVLTGL